MHDTLGGVDVVLPYDARDYLREDNQAEVVMTEKFAIVVALNGQFDIAGGRERDSRRQKQGQQWAGGKAGELQDVVPAEGSPESGQDERELADAMRVEILTQRDETPAEIAARQRPGVGIWIFLVWLLAFAGLAVTAGGGGAAFAGGAAALAALALWLTWRRRTPDAPRKVNRARGEMHAIVLTNPENTQAVSTQLFLGDKLPIKLPDHWRSNLTLPDDGRVDVDVRVDDYAVLRLGGKVGGNFSVDEEQRLFPRVYWGRHATLALAGVLAGAALWGTADSLKGDAALTSAWMRATPVRSYESAAALAQDPPGFGTVVSLQGRARCELRRDDALDRVDFDCNQLRWGGATPQAAQMEVDEQALRLYSGDFLKTRPNPMMDMLIRSQAYSQMRDNPLALYNARTLSAETVVGLSKTVLAIESACETASGEAISACDQLKKAFVDSILLAKEEPEHWLELIRLVEAGAFKAQGRGDDGVMMTRNLNQIRSLARSSTQPVIAAALNRAFQSAMDTQKGGVLLHVLPGPYAALPQLKAIQQDELLAAWSQQMHVMSPDGVMPFKISGMVTGAGAEGSSAPEITVDAARSLDDPWPSLARMAWLLLAALLALVHAPLAFIRWRAASLRERALQEHAQRRGAANPAFF